jgi:hypothetical protein
MRNLKSIFLVIFLTMLILVRSGFKESNFTDRVRRYTRPVEFEYVSWTIDALEKKLVQFTLASPRYLNQTEQREVVQNYLELVHRLNLIRDEIRRIYSDPQVEDPARDASSLQSEEKKLMAIQDKMGPLAESVLQQQISATVDELDLAFLGQPFPPILYQVTPLPLALIVSPRDIIRQDDNISLLPTLTMDQIVDLEQNVESGLNVSALVVEVGGIGMYPTMVMSTTDLSYLIEVVAHEWIHNYLTLRPLGMNYETNPELRTMNETTASIAGREIADAVIAKFYPALIPEIEPGLQQPAPQSEEVPLQPPPFDFRAEMHTTRVVADEFLKKGEILKAEAYMESRREFFWQNGYQIRRLNQAYFAFHGAYADQPGGAAGEDPVGPAVRLLRANSVTLRSFLDAISAMVSFSELLAVVE